MKIAPIASYTAQIVAAPDGPARNFHTLALMREMVNQARIDPRVMTAAHSIIYLQRERDEVAEAKSLYEYVRDHVRYVRDVFGLETLAYPATTLQRLIGDCDDQTTLLCALAEASGYATRLVMAAYHSHEWEHVYCQIFANGQWWNADPIERGGYFGWAPPDPLRLHIERV